MYVEAMGRHAGWIALHAGVADGADVILRPEIPYDPARIVRKVQARVRHGRRSSIVVVAEGARRRDGDLVFRSGCGADPIKDRLGGVSFRVADEIGLLSGFSVRNTVLGHVQRGGSPSPFDRVLATRFGVGAVRAVAEGRFGHMVSLRSGVVTTVPIADAVATLKSVNPAGETVRSARELGICFAAADGSDDEYARRRDEHGAP